MPKRYELTSAAIPKLSEGGAGVIYKRLEPYGNCHSPGGRDRGGGEKAFLSALQKARFQNSPWLSSAPVEAFCFAGQLHHPPDKLAFSRLLQCQDIKCRSESQSFGIEELPNAQCADAPEIVLVQTIGSRFTGRPVVLHMCTMTSMRTSYGVSPRTNCVLTLFCDSNVNLGWDMNIQKMP